MATEKTVPNALGRELRRGTLELILLRLLEEEKMYGYRLVTELRERSDGRLEVKEGTLYPVLYRLERQTLIEPTWEQRERGVPRKYYTLTALGLERLRALEAEWRAFSRSVDSILEGRASADEEEKK